MPTPVYLTGFEHGLATPVTSGGGIAAVVTGSPTIQSTIKNSGTYALRCAPGTAAATYIELTYPATGQTVVVGSLYFDIVTEPSARAEIIMHVGSAISGPRFMWNPTDNKVYVAFGSTGGTASTNALSTGTQYLLDYRITISGTTGTIDWQIDKSPQTQHVDTGLAAGGTLGHARLGFVTAVTGDIVIDDVIFSVTSGDYPIGGHIIAGLSPNADGTHNNAANIMEDSAGNDIDGITYFAFDKLDEVPFGTSASTDYVRQTGNGTGNYCEVQFANMPSGSVIGVVGLLQYASAATSSNNGGCIVISNTTETTIWGAPGALADYSETSAFYKVAPISPDGGSWSVDKVNALRSRFGYSGDANPDPYWLALILEVAYSADVNLTFNFATLASTGPLMDVVPGTKTTNLSNAVLASTGGTITVSSLQPPAQIVLNPASLVSGGQFLSIIPGARSITLTSGVVQSLGQLFSVIPGTRTITLSNANLLSTAQLLGIVPGSATVNFQAGTIVLSGPIADVVPGNVSLALNSALLTSSGQSITLSLATIIALASASIISAGQNIFPSKNILLGGALLSSSGQLLDVVPGTATVALLGGNIATSGQILAVIPGSKITALANAQITSLGQLLTSAPGGYTASLSSAIISVAGQRIYFPKIILLSSGSVATGGQILSVILGGSFISLGSAGITLAGQHLTPVPGSKTTSLNTALLGSTGNIIDVVPGQYIALLNNAIVGTGGQQITIFAPVGSTSVALSNALMNSTGNTIQILPGAVTKILSSASINLSPQQATVIKGTAFVILNSASLVTGANKASVLPGAVTKLLNSGNIVLSPNQVNLVPGSVSVPLTASLITSIGQVITPRFTIFLNTANINLATNPLDVIVDIIINLDNGVIITSAPLSTILITVAYGVRELTLDDRTFVLTLDERTTKLTLDERSSSMTLEDYL